MRYALLSLALLVFSACSDTMGPSEPDIPVPLPHFRMAGTDSDGGGGGGNSCSRVYSSAECALKAAGLVIGGAAIAASSSWGGWLGIVPWTAAGIDYINTPDCRSCPQPQPYTVGPLQPWNDPNSDPAWHGGQ